jgi:RNA polymerase primary sigma factor
MNIKNVEANFVIRNSNVDSFIRELNKIPVLTPQEEKQLFFDFNESKKREAASSDKDIIKAEKAIQDKIRQEIITRNQRFNYAIAKRYDNNDMLMDLVSVGAIGMHEAFENYDVNQTVRFCTYAVYYIRRAINAYLNKESVLVRTSNNTKILPKVKAIRNKYFAQHGEYPTSEYIVKALEKDYGIKDANPAEFFKVDVEYFDQTVVDDNKPSSDYRPDYIAHTASYNEYESVENKEEMIDNIKQLMRNLSEREISIIYMSTGYGYDKEYKDYEIAEILNLSSERVRQLRINACEKMRKSYNKRYANAY